MIREYPDMSFMGGLDLQGVVDNPYCTEEDFRREVRRCIDEYGDDGRFSLYCVSVSMYNPAEFAPGRKLGIVLDETEKYGNRLTA